MDKFIGKVCVVRTYSAGVFFGTLQSLEGKVGVVTNARRLWYWDGAASLSQLANEGVKLPQKCKFPAPVEQVLLTEVIEVIPATQESITSVDGVPEWKM